MLKQIIDKNSCTGCGACVNACPNNAILMKCDADGFQYPVIDNEKCTECDLCVGVCRTRNIYKTDVEIAYIVENKDNDIRGKSSSGGIFSELAKCIIDQGGVVFGAALDDQIGIKHIAVDNVDGLDKLRGSKYVQSDTAQIYREVEKQLKDNRAVLFSGTPCQIAGLRAYLKGDYDNLFLVDLICQGVPGIDIWKKYLELKQLEAKIKHINFRDKSKGWNELYISYEYVDETKKIVAFEDDSYMRGFEDTEILRSSCYKCSFRGLNNCSDITLGDCWGYEKMVGKLPDEIGTSVCLINSKKGKGLFELISPNINTIKSLNADELRTYNKNLFTNPSYTGKRQEFFNLFSQKRYEEAFDVLMKEDRNKAYVEVLYKWLDVEINNPKFTPDKIISLGYKNIAIYGMGVLGNYLWKKLSNYPEINIKYCIDSESKEDCGMHILDSKMISENMFEGIDVIIVTPIHAKYSIIKFLRQYYKGEIISLEEIFDC